MKVYAQITKFTESANGPVSWQVALCVSRVESVSSLNFTLLCTRGDKGLLMFSHIKLLSLYEDNDSKKTLSGLKEAK